MMEEDAEKNPWHYNAEKMIEYYEDPEIIVDTAKRFASNEVKIRERLFMTIYSFIQIDEKFPRDYFKMEIDLYRKLIDFSYTRETEALRVLKYF